MKRTKIAAIDVGATKVHTIMADKNGSGEFRVRVLGVAESNGLEKGVVVNWGDASASISRSVRKAEKMAGYRLESACVGISGSDMASLNNCGVISIPHNNEVVHTSDWKRALDVARSIEVPGDRRLLHVIPRSCILDEQDNIKNPIGMHGFRLQVETHLVVTPAILAQNLMRCITKLGVSIDGLILKSLASAEAVLTEDERQRGVVLADIGGTTTDVAVFKDGSVHHTSTLPVGGYNITHDISVGLGIPFNVAEELKKKYGNAMPSEEKDGDDTVTENGHGICYHDLCEIIEARVEELLRLILFQIPLTDYYKTIPSGLVLTGGSCNLKGIAELGCKVTQLPVRVGIPLNPNGDADTLCDPAYSTSVGLLHWKIMKKASSQEWRTNRWGPRVLLPRFLGYLDKK
jgi:cell division protein FtsA